MSKIKLAILICFVFLPKLNAAAVDFYVGRSLPVLNEPLEIKAMLGNCSSPVEFWVASDNDKASLIAKKTGPFEKSVALCQWTPLKTGSHTLWATSDNVTSSKVEVFVTPRKLHFNFWAAHPGQKWITSLMVSNENKISQDGYDFLRRGVMLLRWKEGSYKKWDSPKTYADAWEAFSSPCAGIIIDEFADGKYNQIMGRALEILDNRRSDAFIAPYCLGVGGQDMINGFQKAADLVLIETYAGDWRSYDTFIGQRCQSAFVAAVGEKSVAVLGLGKWIKDKNELRSQIEYVRTKFPDMPGIGFFGTASPKVYAEIDNAIYDYYIAPVIHCSADENKKVIRVRNIGSQDADKVQVRLTTTKGREVIRNIPFIPAAGEVQLKYSLGQTKSFEPVCPKDNRYNVANYIKPTKFKITLQMAGEAKKHIRKYTSQDAFKPLVRNVNLKLFKCKSDNPRSNGKTERGEIKFNQIIKSPFAFSFKFRIEHLMHYSPLTISLVDKNKGSLGLTFVLDDNDTDFPAGSARAVFFLSGPKGANSYSRTSPTPIRSGKQYSFFVSFEDKSARAIIADENGKIVWDSGVVTAEYDLPVDRLVLGLSAFEDSKIEFDRKKKRVFMCSGMPRGPKSRYKLSGWLEDIKIYFKAKASFSDAVMAKKRAFSSQQGFEIASNNIEAGELYYPIFLISGSSQLNSQVTWEYINQKRSK